MTEIVCFPDVGPGDGFEVEVGTSEHERLVKAGYPCERVSGEPEAGGGDAPDYGKQTNDQLEAEVAERGLTVEGTGQDGRVLKKDLVAALEASDAESGGETLS